MTGAGTHHGKTTTWLRNGTGGAWSRYALATA